MDPDEWDMWAGDWVYSEALDAMVQQFGGTTWFRDGCCSYKGSWSDETVIDMDDWGSGESGEPPCAYGFHYEINNLSGSARFTHILGFPENYEGPFDIYINPDDDGTNGEFLGSYCPGDVVNFGEGVESFTIAGITPLVDAEYIESEAIFAIQLLFNFPSASVTVEPMEPEEFPEAGAWWDHEPWTGNTCVWQ